MRIKMGTAIKLKTQAIQKAMLVGLLVLMLPLGAAIAQSPGDPGGPGGDVDPAAPIDGGITLLLAAGAGLGARKIYLERKKKKEKQA